MKIPEKGNRKKPLFIVNPDSGVIPVNYIMSLGLDLRKEELTAVKSLSKEETIRLITDNWEKHDVYVASGGDGTVHTVATQLVNSDKILGVLPLGSGNGFAREFGFKLNVNSLLSDVRKAETMSIDIIEVNDKMCLNVAGIGLDSFVAHSFNNLRLRGIIPYIWLSLKTFAQLRPFHVKISCEGKELVNEELFVVTIANTRQFGNNAFIAPDARPNDGIIDLVLIKPFPKILGPSFVIRLFTKRINRSKYVNHIRTEKEIVIETHENRMHIDGEPVSSDGKVHVRIKREVLKVLKTPRNKFI
ncbi:MAG TPA: YegS/Rv2252/BmrU family lipid kinase [Bacteroidales bacterium]|nr:YegS/Rv2252/BmrU family lipid kinase [Bacteroidales bacterium]